MIRAELALAAIALVSTGAVASAQAETQTASPEFTVWDHNGSVMYLVANGPSREFYYQKPRAGMLEVGVRPGSLLFRGEIENGEYPGTAYIFNPHCGQIPFQVRGPILDNDERTSEAISTIQKSWKPSRRDGSSLYCLVGNFVSQEIVFVSLIKVFVAIVHCMGCPSRKLSSPAEPRGTNRAGLARTRSAIPTAPCHSHADVHGVVHAAGRY